MSSSDSAKDVDKSKSDSPENRTSRNARETSGVNGDKPMDVDETSEDSKEIESEVKVKTDSGEPENPPQGRKRKFSDVDKDDLSDGSSPTEFLGFPDTRTEEEKRKANAEKKEKQEKVAKLDLSVFDSALGKGKRSRIPNKRYEGLTIKSFAKSSSKPVIDHLDADGGPVNSSEVTSSEDGKSEESESQKHEDSTSEVTSSATGSSRAKSARLASALSVPSTKKLRPSMNMSNPNFLKPFEHGWKRELVYRATVDSNMRRNGDIYYYTPTGKKIRSMRELAENLHSKDLTVEDFSFFKEPIGINDPEKEIVREAKYKSPTVTGKKATPKSKASKEKSAPSPKIAAVSEGPKGGKSPKLVGFKVKIPGSSRLAQSSTQKDRKRGPIDSDLEMGMLPPVWSPKKGSTAKQSSWQAKTGSTPQPMTSLTIGARAIDSKPCRPCSIRCQGVAGLIPTLQCRLCLCLYHKECVGQSNDDDDDDDGATNGYVCKNCQLDNQDKLDTSFDPSPAIGPPPLTPISSLKSNNTQSTTPPKLQRIPRPNEKSFIPLPIQSFQAFHSSQPSPLTPHILSQPHSQPQLTQHPQKGPHRSTGDDSKSQGKFPEGGTFLGKFTSAEGERRQYAEPPSSKSIVGSVTTWFPPNSTIKMNPNAQNKTGTVGDNILAPKPQSLVFVAERKFLVIPKGNVLSISPPTADKAPVFDPKESLVGKILESASFKHQNQNQNESSNLLPEKRTPGSFGPNPFSPSNVTPSGVNPLVGKVLEASALKNAEPPSNFLTEKRTCGPFAPGPFVPNFGANSSSSFSPSGVSPSSVNPLSGKTAESPASKTQNQNESQPKPKSFNANSANFSPTIVKSSIVNPLLQGKVPSKTQSESQQRRTSSTFGSNPFAFGANPSGVNPSGVSSSSGPLSAAVSATVGRNSAQKVNHGEIRAAKQNQREPSPPKTRRSTTRKPLAPPAPVQKIDTESRFMQNYLQNLSYGYQTLLYVFQYLKVQDLLRAGCVCTLWRDISSHPTLWKTIRMKNSPVSNWEGLADALRKHQTENLDLRKMLLPNTGDDMWPLFSKAISRVDSLVRIELCRCPAAVVEDLARTNKNLQVVNAITIRCENLNISSLENLSNLQELRLKSTNGFTLTSDLTPLRSLKKLRHLSLTSVKELHKQNVSIIGELSNLETLDLGECSDFPDLFGTEVLGRLIHLEKLRLEKGQGTCSTFNILEAVSKIPTLEQLELVNFDVKSGFDKALGACSNIKKLLIIPTYISQSATTNHMVLGGVIKLKATLSHFVWGVTLELLRVTELFVDQCEDSPNKDRKKPSGNGDSIPVLKPVPIMKPEEGREETSGKEPPQVEILPLPTLQKLLLNCLPTTRVKILKIPFHATWRQSIVDTVN